MALNNWPFVNNKKSFIEKDVEIKVIPNHVAIIMDGNGRWAHQRGLPRFAGHKQGMDKVKEIVEIADAYEVKILTLYAFSTENWKRPEKEVNYLMRLPHDFLGKYLPDLIKDNVKVEMIGSLDKIPAHTKKSIHKAIEETKDNTGLILNIAMNYGSRTEMTHVMKSIAEDVKMDKLDPSDINEKLIAERLFTAHLPDPDLLIRTSGELRISNFLLWQIAYTEFWFTDAYWPAFSKRDFENALKAYQSRQRRYGALI